MNTNNIQPQNQSQGLALFALGSLVGLMVGGITVLLTAPQPGAKTRAELQQGVEQFRDRTAETVKERVELVKNKASQLQHQGKGLIIKQLDRVTQMAQSGKKVIEESADHVVA